MIYVLVQLPTPHSHSSLQKTNAQKRLILNEKYAVYTFRIKRRENIRSHKSQNLNFVCDLKYVL